MKTQPKVRGVYEHPAGSGTWWIHYYDDGQRHREKIGPRDAAVEAYYMRKRQIRLGQKDLLPKREKLLTFDELADLTIADKKIRLSHRSCKSDRIRLKPIRKAFGHLPAKHVDAGKISAFLAKLRDRNLSGSTVNRYRSLISSVYSFAVRTGKLEVNPCRLVPKFKEGAGRVRYLGKDEEEALRKVLRAEPGGDLYEAEIDLALNTGMRRGEQFGLALDRIDLEHGILTVVGKTGQRFIPINSAARVAIEKLYAASNGSKFLCPGASREGQDDWRRWFEEAVAKAGIVNFTWHDLRHTFASRLVTAGVHLRRVQKYLGHSSIATTERYAHLAPDDQRDNIEKLVAKPDPKPEKTTATKTATSISARKLKRALGAA